MDETKALLAYISDASGHSNKLGTLLKGAGPSQDLSQTLEWLRSNLELDPGSRVKIYWEELQRIARDGISIIHFFEPDYPSQLRELEDPPLLLYKKGTLQDFSRCVAISGTRNPSHSGHRATREVAVALAEAGITVVAGLARGVDLEAHLGALDVNGSTVAVLPGPLTDIYPPEHERITEDIAVHGALLSEMSSFEKPNKLSFIRRNRITTGLSKCLVIGESDGRGGTLQQFRIARKQGRAVFTLRPREENAPTSKGFDKYVKEGAVPVDGADEVVEYLKREPKGQSTLAEYDVA